MGLSFIFRLPTKRFRWDMSWPRHPATIGQLRKQWWLNFLIRIHLATKDMWAKPCKRSCTMNTRSLFGRLPEKINVWCNQKNGNNGWS